MRWQRRDDQSHNKRIQQISTEGVKGETRLDRQGDPSTGKCEGNFNSTIQTNGICTTQLLS